MSLFTSILHGLKQKIDAHNAFRPIIVGTIKDLVGIEISEDGIASLKDGVLTLQVSPTIKMAIIMKKEKLIASLREHNITVSVIR